MVNAGETSKVIESAEADLVGFYPTLPPDWSKASEEESGRGAQNKSARVSTGLL